MLSRGEHLLALCLERHAPQAGAELGSIDPIAWVREQDLDDQLANVFIVIRIVQATTCARWRTSRANCEMIRFADSSRIRSLLLISSNCWKRLTTTNSFRSGWLTSLEVDSRQ